MFQCVKEAILEDLQKIGKEGGLKSFEQVGTADTILVPQVPLELFDLKMMRRFSRVSELHSLVAR